MKSARIKLKLNRVCFNRQRFDYTPAFDENFKGFTINFVITNLWRMHGQYDYDDLMQEAFLCFMKCEDRYPSVVEPRHFMALYKTCLRNHFHDLSTKLSKYASGITDHLDTDDDENEIFKIPDDTDMHTFFEILYDAPKELVDLLSNFLHNAPQPKQQRIKLKHSRKPFKKRKTTNEKFCRILNSETDDKPADAIRMFLK